MEYGFIAIAALVIIVFGTLLMLLNRYKRCPSDKILVVYGKTGMERSSKCIHGGAALIWPVIQNYAWLNLTPMSIEVNLKSALSRQNIRVDVPSRFTVGISTEDPVVMNAAAERLLGQSMEHIQELAKDIIFGQLRLVIATMDIEDINANRDQFLKNVSSNVETELKKIGLKLINVNITDIKDESGYIEALGKEAAAKAVNDARKSVAERERDGSIGQANANRDERISVADANARAVEGENKSKVDIVDSESERRERTAEAEKRAASAEKVQKAKALEESYSAEKEAELNRAAREKATREADIIIPAEIRKREIEIDAEAEAERIRRLAKGEADAIFLKKEAEGRGLYEILSKQAEGFRMLVNASGNDSRDAILFMIADRLPELVRTQVDAIKNIKIDKITVWDPGTGGENGSNSTANFISGLYKSVPPMNELFQMAGMELPDYLKKNSESIVNGKPETEEEEG
jgi:flotillin